MNKNHIPCDFGENQSLSVRLYRTPWRYLTNLKKNADVFNALVLGAPFKGILNFVYGDDKELLLTDYQGTHKMLSVRLAKLVFGAQQAKIDRLNASRSR